MTPRISNYGIRVLYRVVLMPQAPTPAISIELPVCVFTAMVDLTLCGTLLPVILIFLLNAGGASTGVRGGNPMNFAGRSYEIGGLFCTQSDHVGEI